MNKKLVVMVVGILIVSVIFYSFFVGNQTRNFNLSKMFNLYGNVIDYGVYQEGEDLMEKFDKIYAENLEKDRKVYFVFGNKDEVVLSTYEEIVYGKVGLVIGETNQEIDLKESKYVSEKISPEDNKVEIVINGEKYVFELEPNENIYFIIESK